jgi:nucleoside-diphosphate-sugar epimerase
MNVTVTGATGTIGLACIEMLVRAGHRARAFVRRPAEFDRLCSDDRVEVVEGDILDRTGVAGALAAADAVIHCIDFPPNQFSLNWDALRFVLEGLGPGKQLIYPGNAWVYASPENGRVGPDHAKGSPVRLGDIKADLEKAVTGADGTVVNLPEVYGPGARKGRVYSWFVRALADKTVFVPGDPNRTWEPLYIADAARALIAPLGRARARGVDYAACGYGPTTPREFVELIFMAAGHAPRLRSRSTNLSRVVALLRRESRAQRDLSYLVEHPVLLDGSQIRQDLGWVPEVDHREGVRRTMRWLREASRGVLGGGSN